MLFFHDILVSTLTAQKIKFLRIWPHLLKKSLMENFIFCAVSIQVLEETFNAVNNTASQMPVLKTFKLYVFKTVL